MLDKIFSDLICHKDSFFVVRLHSVLTAQILGPIKDPDPRISCELFNGRETFLAMAHDKHYEFSSLRRAKFSTMAMLHEISINSNAQLKCEFNKSPIGTDGYSLQSANLCYIYFNTYRNSNKPANSIQSRFCNAGEFCFYSKFFTKNSKFCFYFQLYFLKLNSKGECFKCNF